MIVRPKVLLLDVDGVIFNHRGTIAKVGNRAIEYVAHELHIDKSSAQHINDLLYSNFGHTYTGLQRIYKGNRSTQDFADFVYNDEMLSSLDSISLEGDLLKNSTDMKYVTKHCAAFDVDVYIFSNAPMNWCTSVLKTMNISDIIDENNIFASDHDLFAGGLKPQSMVYDNIRKYLTHKYRDSSLQLSFVDDSFMNLLPILGDGRWRPIYFNKDGINNARLTTVNTLFDLQRVI